MRNFILQVTATVALASSAFGQGRVIITEIMYNPASTEKKGESEWVEIANVGTEAVEIKDWKLSDGGKRQWGKFSCTLAPGGVAVLINGDAVKEEEFREAWDESGEGNSASPKLNYQVIPVKWGSLSNDAAPEKDSIRLLNDKDEVVCDIKKTADWPRVTGAGGPSIFVSDPNAADLSNGKLWRISENGLDGAHHNKTTKAFDKADCGSPGYVPGLGGKPASTTPEKTPKAKKEKKPKAEEPGEKPAAPDKGGKIDY